jgi:FeS assembly protein IscX
MPHTFGWTNIEDIAEALVETYPDRDPLSVRFTELTGMVEKLEGFAPPAKQTVNEKILEAIQAAWYEEAQDQA